MFRENNRGFVCLIGVVLGMMGVFIFGRWSQKTPRELRPWQSSPPIPTRQLPEQATAPKGSSLAPRNEQNLVWQERFGKQVQGEQEKAERHFNDLDVRQKILAQLKKILQTQLDSPRREEIDRLVKQLERREKKP